MENLPGPLTAFAFFLFISRKSHPFFKLRLKCHFLPSSLSFLSSTQEWPPFPFNLSLCTRPPTLNVPWLPASYLCLCVIPSLAPCTGKLCRAFHAEVYINYLSCLVWSEDDPSPSENATWNLLLRHLGSAEVAGSWELPTTCCFMHLGQITDTLKTMAFGYM